MKPTEHLTITERPGTYITVMSDSRGPIIVVSDGPGARASRYTPEEAAKLGLAILEAAGVEATPMATSVAFGTVVADLQRLIAEQERATAEARELAELEAEALELRNEYFDKECAWSDINDGGQALWLRMARKARELAKEATK